jgi:hypothetical protein
MSFLSQKIKQVWKKACSEANVFNTTQIVHLLDEEYQVNMTKWLVVCVLQLNDSEIQPSLLHPST